MPTYTGTTAYSVFNLADANARSTMFSPDGALIYVARDNGTIDVFKTASHSLVATWTVGASLASMSLSEDGTFLLAIESTGANTGRLHRVSTANGAVLQSYDTGRFHDVEIVDGQRAILTGLPNMTFDFATGTFAPLAGASTYSSYSSLIVEDGHLSLIADPGISNGPLSIYDDRVGRIVAQGDNYQSNVVSGFNWGHQAISEEAGLVVQFAYYQTLNIYDLALRALRTVSISGPVDGLAFDPEGQYLFAFLENGTLTKYDVRTWTIADQFDLAASGWHNRIGVGDQIRISPDGSYITVADSNGGRLQLVDLSARNERFSGTDEADRFVGLDGNDTYIVGAGDVVVEAARQGIDTVQTRLASYALTANVEHLTFTGSAEFAGQGNELDNVIDTTASSATAQLEGRDGNDVLRSGRGNDRLNGGAGIDAMSGGRGDDIYVVDHAGDSIIEQSGQGIDTVEASINYSLISHLENLTLTGGALIGTGNGLANTIRGNALANVLTGGGGIDRLYGQAGDDTYHVDRQDDLVFELTGEGTDTVIASSSFYLYANIENLTLTESAANAFANGNELANIIQGNSGANLMIAGSGNDVARGGGGADQLFGQEGDDQLLGDAGADYLVGGAGADRLDGGADADALYGGEGDDLYLVDDGDLVVEAQGQGTDTVQTALASYTLTADVEQLIFTSTAGAIGRGNDLANVINGGSSTAATFLYGLAGADQLRSGRGDDRLDGGIGIDTLIGGAGNDTYLVDHLEDGVVELAGQGIDQVESTANYRLAAQVENLTLVDGAGDLFGVGNDLANSILGNDGSNLLIAGAGNDFVRGGNGTDQLFGQEGNDQLFGDLGIDYLVGGADTDQLDGGAGADALYGEDGDDRLIGGSDFATDIVVGGAGNDLLFADSGLGDYDLLDGGAGDDGYYVDTPDDLTFEATNGGTDTVYATIIGAGYYLYANVENLELGGETPFGVGNGLANQMTGSASANWLLGGAGDDVLNGKAGDDVLFGEGGADRFVFERGTGGDVIGDFQAGIDRIDLSAFGFASYAALRAAMGEANGTSFIILADGDMVVLNGVSNAALSEADFIL